jgi:hypothetical protein
MEYIEPKFLIFEMRNSDLLEKFCISEHIDYSVDMSDDVNYWYRGERGSIRMYFDGTYHLANKMMAFERIKVEGGLIIPWNGFGNREEETDECLEQLNALPIDEFKVKVKDYNDREYRELQQKWYYEELESQN